LLLRSARSAVAGLLDTRMKILAEWSPHISFLVAGVQCVFPSLDLCCLFVALGVLVAVMVVSWLCTKVFDKIFVRACATTLGFSCIILCFRFD
jgi:hypothetical protein